MDYTLHQLKIFLKVAEKESITKASDELHLTQPAVSIQLKKLQDQFEVPLTEVIGRKLYVTEFGKEIAKASGRILDEVEDIKFKTLAYRGKLVGRLKISVVSTGKYVMPYFLPEFMEQHEGVDLSIDVTNRSAVLKNLENNEVDFSLVSILPENIQFEREPLMDNKLFLVGSKKPELGKRISSKKLLQKVQLIYREEGSATRRVMEKYLADAGVTPLKKMQLTSNEAVKQAVMAGLGDSVMSLSGIKNELQNGDLYIIPLKKFPIITQWNLVWLKGKKFSPVAAAYLDFVRKEKHNLIEKKFSWSSSY